MSLFLNTRFFSTLKKKSSKIWMKEHVTDSFVQKAKLLNYRSRAAFKLIEIQQRYSILRPGQKVLDLGSAPGSWTQVCVEQVKSPQDKPTVLAVDRDTMIKVPGSKFLMGDITDENIRLEIGEFFQNEPIDVILSDMAHNFEGDRDTDHMNIASLNHLVIRMCFNNLKIGGAVLMKTLQGSLEGDFYVIFLHFLMIFSHFCYFSNFLSFLIISSFFFFFFMVLTIFKNFNRDFIVFSSKIF